MAAGGVQPVRVAESRPLSRGPASRVHDGPMAAAAARCQSSINLLRPRPECLSVGGGAGNPRGPESAPPDGVTAASRRRGPSGGGIASLVCAAGPGAMAALGGDGLRLLSVPRPERQPESAALGGPGAGLCCWVSVFSCLSLACSYVGSLYVWKSELPRCGGCARREPAPPRGRVMGGAWANGGGVAPSGGGRGPPELSAFFVGTTLPSSSGASPVSWWCPASLPSAYCSGGNSQASRCEGGGAEGNGSDLSGCGGGSKTDAPFPVAQPGTSLLSLMGFRLEGIFPAALLPLLLTMVSPSLLPYLFFVDSVMLLSVTLLLILIVSSF